MPCDLLAQLGGASRGSVTPRRAPAVRPSRRRATTLGVVGVVEHGELPGGDGAARRVQGRARGGVAKPKGRGHRACRAPRSGRAPSRTRAARCRVQLSEPGVERRGAPTLDVARASPRHDRRGGDVDGRDEAGSAVAPRADPAALPDGHQLDAPGTDAELLAGRRGRRPRPASAPCARRGSLRRPPRGMKQTSWLSGLPAVRSPQARGERAHVGPWSARRPAARAGRAGRSARNAEHVALVLRRVRAAAERRGAARPRTMRAWWPVARASKPRRSARSKSSPNLIDRLHSTQGFGVSPRAWAAT